MKKLAAFLLTVIFMLQTALVGVSAATDKATLEKNEKTVYEFDNMYDKFDDLNVNFIPSVLDFISPSFSPTHP